MAKFSLPKLKLPFGKGRSSLYDPIEEEMDNEPDPFDYDAPTGFQRILPWIFVSLAYLVTAGGVAGVYMYLDSNAEQIEQELIDQRPTNHLDKIEVVRTTKPSKKPKSSDSEPAPEMATDAEKMEKKGDQETSDSMAAEAKTETTEVGDDSMAAEADVEAGAEADTVTTENAAADTETAPATPAIAEDTTKAVRELVPHPADGLIELSKEGPLPITAPDGRSPWRIYARPFNSFETRPKIAIVMTGLGLSQGDTQLALGLPGPVTLAFAPYAPKLDDWIKKARDDGHEVMLTLPMEPLDFPKSDPGPYALLTTLDAAQNTKKLNWILGRATGYIGLLGYQGTKFMSSDTNMRLLSSRLKPRGLLYMDSLYSPVNTAAKHMRLNEIPYVIGDEILDIPAGRSAVIRKLRKLEETAEQKGVAVAVAHPYAVSVKEIKSWSEELQEKGFALVPLSSIAIEGLQNN